MTDPYRRPAALPPEEPPVEEPSPPVARDLGRRISSHVRLDAGAKTLTALGRTPGVDLHMNGLVVEGLLGADTRVLFSEIDEVFYRLHPTDDVPPRVSLVTYDRERVEIPPNTGAERIITEIDREVTRPLLEPAREAFVRGDRLIFGPLVLELDGIAITDVEGKRSLPWSRLPRVRVGREGFAFHMPDTHGQFAFLPIAELPHPGVLVAVLRLRTRVALEEPELLRAIGILPES